jgi:hypothetical protein
LAGPIFWASIGETSPSLAPAFVVRSLIGPPWLVGVPKSEDAQMVRNVPLTLVSQSPEPNARRRLIRTGADASNAQGAQGRMHGADLTQGSFEL